MKDLNRLLEIIADISAGRYSSDVMALTGLGVPEPVRTIAEAMGLLMVKVEAREYHLEMLIKQLEEMNQQVRRNSIATVSAMAKALAARDAYTEGHAERVGQIAWLIAAEIGLTEAETDLVGLAGLLHDIGKIGFPDFLFLPHGSDNPKEIVREIARHPTTGAEILKGLDFLGTALPYIRHHHERPDGCGYPSRLKGTEIPVGAKIIAVADAFDAITTDRPYQKARTFHEALAILKKGAGTKWDAECVTACERILPKIHFQADTLKAPKERLLCLSDDQAQIVLEPGPEGGARMRWLKPEIDFAKYKRIILDRVVFFFAADSEYKGMDPQELKELSDLFNRQLADSLKEKYHIVSTPLPEAARIRFAITDLRQNRPILSNIPSLGPTGFGKTDLKKNLANSWAGSGATSAELLVIDSMTNDVIAAARDDRTVGLRERFTKWGSAEDAFKYWADRLRLFLDQASIVKK
jgi:hypothetical protein